MARFGALRRKQAPILYPAGVRPWVPGHLRNRTLPLQMHGALFAEGRNGNPLGRPCHRHPMAPERPSAFRARQQSPATERRPGGKALRMTLPRLLLIGKIGQVGWELRRTLAPMAQVTCVDFPEIDLTSGDSIRQWVRDAKPQVIINAAAYTAVDKAETEPDRAMQINGLAPGILAEEAKKTGSLLVHYSTDYIFDGSKTEPYVETDKPNPLGSYGRSKLAGDNAVLAAGGSHLIFRLCWVYGARGQNFMLTMMRLARERDKLRVVSDQVGCPT